jgi:threonine synthase
MLYCSTRGGERGVPFSRALLTAYASDGGLFVPESIPQVPLSTLASWASLTLSEVCARVMEYYVDLPLRQLEDLTASAFKTFNGGAEPPLPLRSVDGKLLLDTGLGPTLAFKDVGQQVVARLLSVYLAREGGHANVIVETSGDTGPAAIAGVAGLASVDIFCLYPSGRVSAVQELQMVTLGFGHDNVHVFRTEGDTDEQAEALKLLFSDAQFMATHRVVSINTIKLARVMVQSAYYFWAALQAEPTLGRPVHFVVPTGAFGNCTGGLLAKLMGVHIGKIACATNANDVVHRTISAGDLSMAPNVPTISPAMDIQFAYNIERMLYLVSGGDCALAARYMCAAQQRRPERLPPWLLRRVQDVFASAAVSDAQTRETMRAVHERTGFTLDPHSATAVFAASLQAVKASLHLRGPPGAKVVCVLTAHPAKFESACEEAGVPVAIHPAVEALRARPRAYEWLRAPPEEGGDKLAAWAAAVKAKVERVAEVRRRERRPQCKL